MEFRAMAIHEPTTAPNRRAVFTTIGAAAAAVVAGIKVPAAGAGTAISVPPAAPITASPIRRAIAEYQAAAEAHDKVESAADKLLWAAFPEPMEPPEAEEEYPAEIRALYAESDRYFRVMDATYTQIMGMPCASLADCVAVLEWGADDASIA